MILYLLLLPPLTLDLWPVFYWLSCEINDQLFRYLFGAISDCLDVFPYRTALTSLFSSILKMYSLQSSLATKSYKALKNCTAG